MPEQQNRLKYTEIKPTRLKHIDEQNNLCALCNHVLDAPVLDHDHKSGHIRKVLCRGCNFFLGKIENNLTRNRITDDKLFNIINNLREYITTDYTSNQIHPTHNKKRRKR